ncbi:MAG TPA: sigma-70 family RNA polymerase sigma factor [Solirubrobacterales bacterium]|nr:sigma-70 family RNA polymerase sigma factor [Solirubrobacterales bacterium]
MGPGQIEMEALGQELVQVRFTKLYREHGRAVLEYALRRVEQREDAADVVAETFLVVWRRIGEVPIGDGARLWLYGVARNVLANLHRAERRRTRLGRRLAETLRTEIAAHPEPSGEAAAVLRAVAALGEEDRELLLLVTWEELSPSEAGRVLGISAPAARTRLHRARRRLRRILDERDTEGVR